MIKNREESNTIRQTYKSELRLLRESKGYSLNEVAKYTEISKQTLHQWENGTIKNVGARYKPNVKKLAKIYEINDKEILNLVNKAWIGFKKQTAKYQKNVRSKTYLYELRVNNYKTLQNVADVLNVSIYKILRIEDGTKAITSSEISKLAKYFNVNENELRSKFEV